MTSGYSSRRRCSDVSRNQQKVNLDLSSHAPLGADESKNLKERSCTSASSAERLGPSAMTSVYVPGGSAAGTAPNIGQECGHEPAGTRTEPLGRRSTNASSPRAAATGTSVHHGPAPASGRVHCVPAFGSHRSGG